MPPPSPLPTTTPPRQHWRRLAARCALAWLVAWPAGLALADAAPTASAAAAPAPGASASAVALPLYPTRLPPALRVRYKLSRGLLSGQGELRWAPRDSGDYEASLQGSVLALNVLDWSSQGRIDRHGVAPDRFTLRRRGREPQVARFERSAGKISYSGKGVEFALPPGAQDRLSWIVQLAGVLAAAPARHGPGSSLVFFVSGARGDADAWTFTMAGRETLQTPAGALATQHWRREPRRPHDTRVDVWVDPARHYLPLRLRLGAAEPDSAPLEFWRDDPD